MTPTGWIPALGFGIGVAFQASAAVGGGVPIAVLANDFLDGANAVTLSLDGDAPEIRARASELLPRSQAGRPKLGALSATGPGMSFIYAVVRLAEL